VVCTIRNSRVCGLLFADAGWFALVCVRYVPSAMKKHMDARDTDRKELVAHPWNPAPSVPVGPCPA
jgi:hypothetical protein